MLKTEMRNPKTTHLDTMPVSEAVTIMCEENYNAAKAVEAAAPSVIKAVNMITESLKSGGRLFFVGAGTSGRLGILEAAECPPTFGIDFGIVNGIIAGGNSSIVKASEDAEDSEAYGIRDIESHEVCSGDVVVGISVSGGAAYVVGALKRAKAANAAVISLSSNKGSLIESISDVAIVTDTGAEVLTGSTRLKAGSSHKMVLNILTTCAMAQLGYVYENMMINLKPSNKKLKNRMCEIVSEICRTAPDKSAELLQRSGMNIKEAIRLHQEEEK